MRAFGVLLLALGLVACGRPGRSPRAAFERVRVAAATRDARVLYDALDTDSRWAVDTVWKYQREIAALAEGFPAEARARTLARVETARATASPREFFAVQAYTGDPFARLGGGGVEGLGGVARVDAGGGGARVVTTTGLVVPMARDGEGTWGWSGLREELTAWRHATANDLTRLREDAALYARGR